MKSNFDHWNIIKQGIHTKQTGSKIFFKERDIFFVSLGINIGDEQNGKGIEFLRPVLVLKKFSHSLAFIIPLSTKEKQGKFYFNFTSSVNIKTTAILSQARLIDMKRALFKKGVIQKEDFRQLRQKLATLLSIDASSF